MGRPKKEATVVMRVPASLAGRVRALVAGSVTDTGAEAVGTAMPVVVKQPADNANGEGGDKHLAGSPVGFESPAPEGLAAVNEKILEMHATGAREGEVTFTVPAPTTFPPTPDSRAIANRIAAMQAAEPPTTFSPSAADIVAAQLPACPLCGRRMARPMRYGPEHAMACGRWAKEAR